jgi:mRNA interferase RelE/StbE
VTYEVQILRSAQQQLARIEREAQSRIISAVEGLAHDPRPHGSKKLTGRPAWRIRIGRYRVIPLFPPPPRDRGVGVGQFFRKGIFAKAQKRRKQKSRLGPRAKLRRSSWTPLGTGRKGFKIGL